MSRYLPIVWKGLVPASDWAKIDRSELMMAYDALNDIELSDDIIRTMQKYHLDMFCIQKEIGQWLLYSRSENHHRILKECVALFPFYYKGELGQTGSSEWSERLIIIAQTVWRSHVRDFMSFAIREVSDEARRQHQGAPPVLGEALCDKIREQGYISFQDIPEVVDYEVFCDLAERELELSSQSQELVSVVDEEDMGYVEEEWGDVLEDWEQSYQITFPWIHNEVTQEKGHPVIAVDDKRYSIDLCHTTQSMRYILSAEESKLKPQVVSIPCSILRAPEISYLNQAASYMELAYCLSKVYQDGVFIRDMINKIYLEVRRQSEWKVTNGGRAKASGLSMMSRLGLSRVQLDIRQADTSLHFMSWNGMWSEVLHYSHHDEQICVAVKNADPQLQCRISRSMPHAYVNSGHDLVTFRIVAAHGASNMTGAPLFDPLYWTVFSTRILPQADTLGRVYWVTVYSPDRIVGIRPVMFVDPLHMYLRKWPEGSSDIARSVNGVITLDCDMRFTAHEVAAKFGCRVRHRHYKEIDDDSLLWEIF